MINTSVVQVTPEMAASMLQANVKNRPLRKSHVTQLAASIRAGEWKLTHQGVAFDVNGHLIDGQHRLHAIIASGITVPVLVATGADPQTYDTLDIGAHRSLTDITGLGRPRVETVTSIARLVLKTGKITPPIFERFDKVFGQCSQDLHDHCGTTVRIFSAASVRAGVVIRSVAFPSQRTHAFNCYRLLVDRDFSQMPPAISALVRQLLEKKLKPNEMLARVFRATEIDRAHLSKIQLKDVDLVIADVARVAEEALQINQE